MNLVEFPLTVLSTRANPKIKTLEFHDTLRAKNGELLERAWIITGADKFGLPTSSDDEVLLGLLKLTVQDGMQARKIFFTRYELLKILRWTTEGRSYSRLQNAFDRLSGVRIKATNAFFDNESKLYSTRNFGILDGYEINNGRDHSQYESFFIWSEVLFNSFQVGFIKKLDLDFYLDLQSSVSKRLYRYLDKHFWYRSSITMNVFTLAHEKVGISRTYQYVSSLRQQLDPALEELQAKGFISSFEFRGRGSSCEAVIHAAQPSRARLAAGTDRSAPADRGDVRATTSPAAEFGSGTDPQFSGNDRQQLEKLLVERGIKHAQAARLIRACEVEEFDRVRRIIDHFDSLKASGSRLVSRSPIGFLYRAVENFRTFVLPTDRAAPLQLERVGEKSASPIPRIVEPEKTAKRSAARARGTDVEAQYLVARKQAAQRFKGSVEATLLDGLRADAEQALSKLRSLISEHRFREAVEHGVEEKLLSLFAFPSFDEWLTDRGMVG